MKITLVTETFPPEINGVAMTLNRLVTRLGEQGHTVEVVRPRQRQEPEHAKNFAEFLVRGFPIPGYSIMQIGRPAANLLKKRWTDNPPDCVHVATEGPLGRSAVSAAQKIGIPLVTSFHTNFHDYLENYGVGFLEGVMLHYLKSIHNQAPVTFVPSLELIDKLKQSGFNAMQLFGRGVDTELFTPERRSEKLRQSWGADAETPVVLYVGRMAKEKAIPETLATFRKLKALNPKTKIVLVGEGPILNKLKKNYPEAIFAGAKRNVDLATYYASGDFFIFASITETFGNVVTEALASGLVVLAYNYAAPGKYIENGKNGFTVPLGDFDQFQACAIDIFEKQSSWEQIRRNARETALKLPWEPIFSSYLESVEKVASA